MYRILNIYVIYKILAASLMRHDIDMCSRLELTSVDEYFEHPSAATSRRTLRAASSRSLVGPFSAPPEDNSLQGPPYAGRSQECEGYSHKHICICFAELMLMRTV